MQVSWRQTACAAPGRFATRAGSSEAGVHSSASLLHGASNVSPHTVRSGGFAASMKWGFRGRDDQIFCLHRAKWGFRGIHKMGVTRQGRPHILCRETPTSLIFYL
jgi:hypothetical protein